MSHRNQSVGARLKAVVRQLSLDQHHGTNRSKAGTHEREQDVVCGKAYGKTVKQITPSAHMRLQRERGRSDLFGPPVGHLIAFAPDGVHPLPETLDRVGAAKLNVTSDASLLWPVTF